MSANGIHTLVVIADEQNIIYPRCPTKPWFGWYGQAAAGGGIARSELLGHSHVGEDETLTLHKGKATTSGPAQPGGVRRGGVHQE